MDKEQLNSKLKDMKKQAEENAQKTKESLGKAFDKENVKKNLDKAKAGIGKAVDGTMNSTIVKRMSPKQKLTVLGVSAFLVIVAIALLGRLFFSPEPSIWCMVDAPKQAIAFRSAGEVVDVAFSANQKVTVGTTIARLNDEAYRTDYEEVSAKLLEANLKYLNMENRLIEQEVALAELKIKAAQSAFEAAESGVELARAYEEQYRANYENNEISEAQYLAVVAEVANADAAKQKAENELEKAKQSLVTAEKTYSSEEIEEAKNEADTLTEQVAQAKASLDGAYIIAPFDSHINSIDIKVGDTVEPGVAVGEVIDMNRRTLRGLVDKSMSLSIKAGAIVNVKFVEIQNEVFTGRITRVNSSQPVEQKDGVDMYEIRIELDILGDRIMPGMEAVALIVSK